MKKQKVLGLLMAGAMSLSALSAAPALAQADGHRGHVAHAKGMQDGMHGPMDKMFDKLNLTAEQREKIKTLRQQGQERNKAQREQLMTKRKELHQLVRSASSTREQAIAKQREVNALQDQLAEARLNAWFEMRAVLTPEQLKQLEQFKPQRGEKRKR
ncbi:periplasmic protein [compost metagenome]